MLKLLIIAILSSRLLAITPEDKVLNFLKHNLVSNKDFKIKKITIKSSQDISDIPNWKAYFANIEVTAKNQDLNLTEIIFSNGEYFTQDFINLDTRDTLKNQLGPKAEDNVYNSSHYIAGNKNAKNKLLLFSDPNCPFCMNFVPFVIEVAKKYPDTFVLYYYDFPLNMHKSAKGFIKAMNVADKMGIKDVVYKTYKARLRSGSSDESKILKKFNEALDLNITTKQINEPWVLKRLEHDINVANSMMINSTPTLYVNGKKDFSREIFKKLYEQAKGKK